VQLLVDTGLTKLEKISFLDSQFGSNWFPVQTEQVLGDFLEHTQICAHFSFLVGLDSFLAINLVKFGEDVANY
jgi:hypothetical protein